METWKDIIGFEGNYVISNLSRIKNLQTGKILKQRIIRGYSNVGLCKHNIKSGHRVHRLLAKAFIPNPDNKPFINHKNGIRDDNRLCNLEWCTNSENQLHSFRELGRIHPRPGLGKTGALCKNSKPVVQLTTEGIVIREWPAAAEAGRQLGIYGTNITNCCTGRYRTTGGFKWRYA